VCGWDVFPPRYLADILGHCGARPSGVKEKLYLFYFYIITTTHSQHRKLEKKKSIGKFTSVKHDYSFQHGLRKHKVII